MKRIQRKRTKGWKMPENTVYVGRPTMWGNPFKLIGDMIYVDASHRRKILSPWVCYGNQNEKFTGGGYGAKDVVRLFRDLMMDLNSHPVEDAIYQKFRLMRDRIRDLEGRDLSCFCKDGEPCHAEVFIEMLSSEPEVQECDANPLNQGENPDNQNKKQWI